MFRRFCRYALVFAELPRKALVPASHASAAFHRQTGHPRQVRRLVARHAGSIAFWVAFISRNS
jgi:hypothetical protein